MYLEFSECPTINNHGANGDPDITRSKQGEECNDNLKHAYHIDKPRPDGDQLYCDMMYNLAPCNLRGY